MDLKALEEAQVDMIKQREVTYQLELKMNAEAEKAAQARTELAKKQLDAREKMRAKDDSQMEELMARAYKRAKKADDSPKAVAVPTTKMEEIIIEHQSKMQKKFADESIAWSKAREADARAAEQALNLGLINAAKMDGLPLAKILKHELEIQMHQPDPEALEAILAALEAGKVLALTLLKNQKDRTNNLQEVALLDSLIQQTETAADAAAAAVAAAVATKAAPSIPPLVAQDLPTPLAAMVPPAPTTTIASPQPVRHRRLRKEMEELHKELRWTIPIVLPFDSKPFLRSVSSTASSTLIHKEINLKEIELSLPKNKKEISKQQIMSDKQAALNKLVEMQLSNNALSIEMARAHGKETDAAKELALAQQGRDENEKQQNEINNKHQHEIFTLLMEEYHIATEIASPYVPQQQQQQQQQIIVSDNNLDGDHVMKHKLLMEEKPAEESIELSKIQSAGAKRLEQGQKAAITNQEIQKNNIARRLIALKAKEEAASANPEVVLPDSAPPAAVVPPAAAAATSSFASPKPKATSEYRRMAFKPVPTPCSRDDRTNKQIQARDVEKDNNLRVLRGINNSNP